MAGVVEFRVLVDEQQVVDGRQGGSEREVVCDSLGPATITGGRRMEAVMSEEVHGRRDIGQADPRCPRLRDAYLLRDRIEGARARAEVTTERGGQRRERRKRWDSGHRDLLGTSSEVVENGGKIITPLVGGASGEHIVGTREEHRDVQVLSKLGQESVADAAGGGTELPDHFPRDRPAGPCGEFAGQPRRCAPAGGMRRQRSRWSGRRPGKPS